MNDEDSVDVNDASRDVRPQPLWSDRFAVSEAEGTEEVFSEEEGPFIPPPPKNKK